MRGADVIKPAGRTLALWIVATLRAFTHASRNPAGTAGDPINYETARLSKVATALQITEAISIDRYLDEAAWERAVPGRPSSESTDVRSLSDPDNLRQPFFSTRFSGAPQYHHHLQRPARRISPRRSHRSGRGRRLRVQTPRRRSPPAPQSWYTAG